MEVTVCWVSDIRTHVFQNRLIPFKLDKFIQQDTASVKMYKAMWSLLIKQLTIYSEYEMPLNERFIR